MDEIVSNEQTIDKRHLEKELCEETIFCEAWSRELCDGKCCPDLKSEK